MEFGCSVSYCLILPTLLSTFRSPGANDRQSVVCWFSGMIHLRKGILHVSLQWLLWDAHAWSSHRNLVLRSHGIQCECDKMRRGYRNEIKKVWIELKELSSVDVLEIIYFKKNKVELWPSGSVCWSVVLCTKRLPVWVLVGAYTYIAGSILGRETALFLSLCPPSSLSQINF